MKYSNAEKVGDIISRVLKEENLDWRLDEQRIVILWPEVVGAAINRYTTQRYIKDHIFYAHISSPSLRNELLLHRSQLVKALNDIVGRTIINDIIFR